MNGEQLNTAEVPDTVLVTRAKGGDLNAFEALVTRHERGIYNLAYRMLGNQHDAQDVTQQTFMNALEHLAEFREESSFATWLYRIASNAALKLIRKRRGLDTVSLEQNTEPQEDTDRIPHPEYIADWKQTPDTLAQHAETREILERALAQLDEKHRLVFILRDVEGLSIKETADALGISEANVKVRLLRARLQLRELLTRAFGDESQALKHHGKVTPKPNTDVTFTGSDTH